MCKKIIITFLISSLKSLLLNKTEKDKFPQLAIEQFEMIENKNLHLLDSLFKANKENSFEIKNYLEIGHLAFQQRFCSYDKNFHNF